MQSVPVWVIILLPAVGLVLHELTHLVVAKAQGARGIHVVSVFPFFRLGVEYPDTVSPRQLRLMALAPFITGVSIALVSYFSGLWSRLQTTDPYYFHVIALLSWLCYTHISPADIKTAWQPREL